MDDMTLDDDKVVNNEAEKQEFSLDATDFAISDEYKEDPLAAQGTYNGITKFIEYNKNIHAITWSVVATENPGITLLDGETPVDGVEFQFNNWLPKPGDENIRSKNGKSTKRQNKINSLKRFQEDMSIDMNTPDAVAQALENGEWIGISVIFKLGINTYTGKDGISRTNNQINSMKRSEEEFNMPDDMVPF